jgi:hypothetical protein
MSINKLAKELEKAAALKGVDIYVDITALKHSFIPIISNQGVVGAVGEYQEDNSVKTGFFILNEKIVRYALNEGFNKEQIFDCFKDRIFIETSKEDFFKIMLNEN